MGDTVISVEDTISTVEEYHHYSGIYSVLWKVITITVRDTISILWMVFSDVGKYHQC